MLFAISICAVLFDHYVEIYWFKPGVIGVRFFLFLSGFLITSTLIRYESVNCSQNGLLVKSFYARRALRIWPLYYVIIIFSLLLNWITTEQFLVHALFMTNFAQAWYNDWNYPWFFAHLWTLCVQEQFYLLWPVLFVVLQAKRWVVLVLMIISAVLFRIGLTLAGYPDASAMRALPVTSFDALAAGSLGAMYHDQLNRWIRHPLSISGALFVGCIVFHVFGGGIVQSALLPTLWLLPLGLFTLGVFHDRFGSVAKFLTWRPLVFLGRISLGIYLLHLPVWQAVIYWGPPGLLSLVGKPSIFTFAMLTPAIIILATVSWLLFERPIQRYRKFFPYQRLSQVTDAVQPTT